MGARGTRELCVRTPSTYGRGTAGSGGALATHTWARYVGEALGVELGCSVLPLFRAYYYRTTGWVVYRPGLWTPGRGSPGAHGCSLSVARAFRVVGMKPHAVRGQQDHRSGRKDVPTSHGDCERQGRGKYASAPSTRSHSRRSDVAPPNPLFAVSSGWTESCMGLESGGSDPLGATRRPRSPRSASLCTTSCRRWAAWPKCAEERGLALALGPRSAHCWHSQSDGCRQRSTCYEFNPILHSNFKTRAASCLKQQNEDYVWVSL